MRIMMSAGEASGDMHAADLITALEEQQGNIEFFGVGGSLMRAAGMDLILNATALSTVGFMESLRNVKVVRRALSYLADEMERRRPHVVVCIDSPGFNMKLAEIARRKRIPVVYYLGPSVWAWGQSRAEQLARLRATVCAVFPFEEKVYRDVGADVVFVGHPLLDRVRPKASREQVRQEWGVGGAQRLIALLPGSRAQELKQLLPRMLQAAAIIHKERPETSFVLPVAHTLTAQTIKEHLPQQGDFPLAVVEGRTYDLLNAADAGLLSMGTATLEAAMLGLPHVACYRVSGTTYMLAKRMVKVEHLALPNIVAGRRIVPELTQSDVTGNKLAGALLPLLEAEQHASVKAELAKVRSSLGEPGAVDRTAAIVLDKARRFVQEQT